MAAGHRLKTESTRGGVLAVCSDLSCDWSGTYKYKRVVDKNARPRVYEDAEDQVWPNRQLAASSHAEFHKKEK